MDLRSIIAQISQLEEGTRKVSGTAYGGSAQKDDKDDKPSKDLDTSGGSDIQDMIGKPPTSKEVGTKSVSHKLKEYMEQVEAEKHQLDEANITVTPGTTQHIKDPKGDVIASVSDPTKAKQLATDIETGKVKMGQPQGMAEEQVTEVAPPGMENWIKGRKEAFKKQYGDRWEGVLYATAWDEYNKKHKKNESMYESAESDKQPIMESILEEILEAFPHEHKMCQEGWSMDEGLYEALCDHYYKEGRIPRKIWHGPLEELRRHVESCYMEDTGVMHEAKKEYDFPPSMRKPATLDTVGVKPTVDLVPQQQANRELNKQLDMEPSMKKSAFETSEREFAFEGAKKLDEKWAGDAKIEKTGEYAGKSLEELEKMLSKLKKSGPHKEGSPQYKKQNQIEFAIRSKHKGKKFGKVEESWDSQLQTLLQEGLTVTTSTGGPMGQEDSVSVSASGEDAKAMMELLRNAGIGHGGADGSNEMGPEVTDQDEVLGQLSGQEHDDSGDTDLSFLKKMIGTPVEADCGCEEGQTQTASPGDAHISPMANKMDEDEVEEGGNRFTYNLLKAREQGKDRADLDGDGDMEKVQKESDDLGPVTDTGGKCNMVHKTSGKEIVVRDEPDVIKKYEAMGYKKQVGESDDLGPVTDTGGKCNMVHKTSGKEIVVRDEPDVIKKYEAMGYKKQVGESDDEDHANHTEKSSTGGRIERKDGVTKHHAGKHYGGSESDKNDDEKVDESYDSQDPTDVAGIDDERSEAVRDAGLAASYVPEEALDQPATFEGKSCMECGSPMEESAHECNECGYMEESGYTFEGLFKKLAMIAEESTVKKDDKAEEAGEKVTKDIEYDENHDYYFGKDRDSSSKVRHTATGHKAEKTDKGTKYTKKHDDKLDEWANSPQNKLSDEEFQTEMNYMLQALSGGLNGPKVDNTTLPKTQTRPVVESESLDGWLRLAGIK